MQKRLYVGNLAPTVNETRLRSFFDSYGRVDNVEVVYDHETSRSKGFGYVTFLDAKDAGNGLSANGKTLDALTLRVSYAQERQLA